MIAFYDGATVKTALPMPDAIEAVCWAYIAVATGQASLPPRIHLTHPTLEPPKGVTLVMPSFVAASPDGRFPASLAVKTVSVYPANVAQGIPAILGSVLVLDPDTGNILALLDGATLTAIRTGAGSAAATSELARENSTTLAILGAGGQAETQLEGICAVRPIEQVFVHSRNLERAHEFAARMQQRPDISANITVARTVNEAVCDADIICTATGATEPLFDAAAVKPGIHLNAVGAHRPDMCEIPAALLIHARLFADQRAACLAEAGDYLQAIRQGVITAEHIEAEIGCVLNGEHPGRRSESEITVFKSVGLAAQDAVCGAYVARRAIKGKSPFLSAY